MDKPLSLRTNVVWVDPKSVVRGTEFNGLKCTYITFKPGGGAGMGAYPETWTAVLSDGSVLSYDPWIGANSVSKGLGHTWGVVALPFDQT